MEIEKPCVTNSYLGQKVMEVAYSKNIDLNVGYSTTGATYNVTIRMIYDVHKIMDHICGLMINIKNSPKK